MEVLGACAEGRSGEQVLFGAVPVALHQLRLRPRTRVWPGGEEHRAARAGGSEVGAPPVTGRQVSV